MTQSAELVADTAADTIVFDLPPDIDAAGAAALIADMIKLPQANAISLNAAAVSSVSLGYLQVLVSAFKTFPKLTVSAVSAEFAEAFGGYGIAYPFAEPAVVDAPEAASVEAMPVEASPVEASPVEAPPIEAPPIEAPPVEAVAPPLVPDAPAPESIPPVQAESDSEADAGAARTILTIDDSRTMRDMLRLALGGAGFTVVQAVDGQDGLKVLPQQPVDVIITDINMPKLDGYGVIRAVRSDPAYDDTPILVLSTEAEQGSKDIANEAGANGWIVKPFDPEGLVKLINTVCE
jgi:two-component system, chemotaxis family, chemotaxis protein CheY